MINSICKYLLVVVVQETAQDRCLISVLVQSEVSLD